MTLGSWFKDYVYMPLVIHPKIIGIGKWVRVHVGKRAGKAVLTIIPLAVTWVLTGLWHGTGVDYVLWGCYWGILIILANVFAPELKKLAKEYADQLAEQKTEAEKLAKMNAEQKAEYEKKKQLDELARREADITRRELRAEALVQLGEKGLPAKLADVLDYSSADACTNSINSVSEAFQQAVAEGVAKVTQGGKPPKAAPEGGKLYTREELKAMTPAEINANWDSVQASLKA